MCFYYLKVTDKISLLLWNFILNSAQTLACIVSQKLSRILILAHCRFTALGPLCEVRFGLGEDFLSFPQPFPFSLFYGKVLMKDREA